MKPTMRYFVRVDDDPESDAYMLPQSLHRWGIEGGGGDILLERWGRDESQWVDNPALIAACGIGGDEDYVEITKREATQLLDEWDKAKQRGDMTFSPKVQGRDYPSPHCGRPGEVGGSAPREECATGAEKPDLFVFDEYHSTYNLPDELMDEVWDWGGDRSWAGRHAVESSIAGRNVFVLSHEGEIVGVAAISQEATAYYLATQLPMPALTLAWIATKRTSADAYGTRLMLRIVLHAIERGCGLCGGATEEALPFYLALGAKVLDEDDRIIFMGLGDLKQAVGNQRSDLRLDEAADIDWAAWAKLEPADGVFVITPEEVEEPDEKGETKRGGPGSGYHRPHKGRPGQVGGSAPRDNGADDKPRATGQCYYTAGKWMMENAEWMDFVRLAHGTVVGQGPVEGIRFGHAWIEISDAVVIDTERGLTLPKEQYYRVGQIKDVVLYTYDEMLKEMLKHEHYGPWHEGSLRGGPGSGYHAPHKGRPGEIGGSAPRDGAGGIATGRYSEGGEVTTEKIDYWLVDGLPTTNPEYLQELGWRRIEILVGSDARAEIVQEIAGRTGVEKGHIAAIMRMWQMKASGNDLRSLHLQRLAAEEFGMEVRPAILERIADVTAQKEELLAAFPSGDALLDRHHSFVDHGISEADQRHVLRAMYDNTQEKLAKAGFGPKDTIRLWRGTYVARKIQINWERGQEIELVGNPLSSWSIGLDKAANFAIDPPVYRKSFGVVFEMDVPREAIMSTARTGLGTLWEGEFVLLMDKLGHRAKVLEMYPPRARSSVVSARNGASVPVVDIDWCEENEDWLRSKSERGGPGSGYHAPHYGRPGEVGGSAPRDGDDLITENQRRKAFVGSGPKGEDTTTKKIDHWLTAGIFPEDDYRQSNLTEVGWEYCHGAVLGAVEDQIIDELISYSTDITEQELRDIMLMWRVTAADEDMRSLELQRLAAEEFGMEVRPSILERIARIKEKRDPPPGTRRQIEAGHYSFAEIGISEDVQRVALRAMYDNTQDQLWDAGFVSGDTIRLRRGAYIPREVQTKWAVGQEVELVGNPLSSWTVGREKAKIFASMPSAKSGRVGVIFEMDVPVEAIMSTARTGVGVLFEGEFVLFADELGHRAKILSLYYPPGQRAIVAKRGDDIPVVDVDWCEENEDWLRPQKGDGEPLLSTEESMEDTAEWWREHMPPRYAGLPDATLREKEADNG